MGMYRFKIYTAIGFLVVGLICCASWAWAHWGGGYQYTEYAVAHNPDWMGQKEYSIGGQLITLYLSDDLHISELSIPGTHDTFSKVKHSWIHHNQMMNLPQQLESGIRVLDVRCNGYANGLQTAHGDHPMPMDPAHRSNWPWFGEVLEMCVDFLVEYPTETILLRLQRNNNLGQPGTPENFAARFDDYMHHLYKDGTKYWADWFWHPFESDHPTNPTLGEVRGKIVLLQSFPADSLYGLDYLAAECCICKNVNTDCDSDAPIKVQDSYDMSTNWSLSGWKAGAVLDHFYTTAVGDPMTIYVNYLSGSGGTFPYFVASGHSSPETGAPHLWMGKCHKCGLMIRNRIGCCYFNGTNEVAKNYLIRNRTRGGIVMADFPGPALINILIEINYEQYSNWPPIAISGSAYEAEEGTPIVFDGSESTDPEGDPLQFRWDFDNDGIWDTEWSDDPTAEHTWYDNACQHDPALYPSVHPDTVGLAALEVRDAEHTAGDAAVVIIYNVAPMVSIDEGYLTPCVLPGQPVPFNALFSDPGCLDTHTATWSFGDGTVLPGTVTQETECPDVTGMVSAVHTFKDLGLQYVHVMVEDDDRGIGMDTAFVQVMTPLEAIDCAIDFIQNLDDDCLKKPASQRKKTLTNKLTVVKDDIIAENIKGAVEKLRHDIRAKADGSIDGHPNNDWIICQNAQRKLCMTFDGIIGYLKSGSTGGGDELLAGTVEIRNLKASRLESGIELTWDVHSNDAIDGFRIERRLEAPGQNDGSVVIQWISPGERRYIDSNIREGQTYLYTLVATGEYASGLASETVSVKTRALNLILHQNHPNPFNPATTITFELPGRARVKLSIFSIAGTQIKSLVDGVMDDGLQEAVWDGRDGFGNPVSSGIYFYRLTVGNNSLTRKMVLLK